MVIHYPQMFSPTVVEAIFHRFGRLVSKLRKKNAPEPDIQRWSRLASSEIHSTLRPLHRVYRKKARITKYQIDLSRRLRELRRIDARAAKVQRRIDEGLPAGSGGLKIRIAEMRQLYASRRTELIRFRSNLTSMHAGLTHEERYITECKSRWEWFQDRLEELLRQRELH